MSLCNLCSTVPFSSLPSPLSATRYTRIADNDNLPALFYKDAEAVDREYATGFSWHEDLDALAASAKTCSLCALVQKGIDAWLDRYNDALANDKLFVEFHESQAPIPHGERLWLKKRFGGAPGFVVSVRNPKKRNQVIVLAGVSFAVEASTWSGNEQ
jgi:hypothetical protein